MTDLLDTSYLCVVDQQVIALFPQHPVICAAGPVEPALAR
jgi:hypothetical protein